MRTVIRHVDLISVNPEPIFTSQVHLGIEGERIAFVLPADSPEAERRLADFAAQRTISGAGKLAMPGLVNTHTHVGMSILRNYGSDLNLQDWLHTKVFPSEAQLVAEDIHWAGLLEMAEMIRSGTTGFIDMYFFPEEGAANIVSSGLRAKLSHNIIDLTFGPGGVDYQTIFPRFRNFHKEWDGWEGRLKIMALVHSTYLPPLAALRDMGEFIQAEKLAVHTHMHETAIEITDSLQKYGKRPIALAEELGLFSPRTVVAHCVHLDDDDRRILAARGVHVAHCPSSNLKLASGIANLEAMLQAGVNLSLGTDGASSNNNLNMFEELHLAAILQKGAWGDPRLQPASQMLQLATRQAALALEMDPELGTLKEGAPADLILLDTDAAHWVPRNDPIAAVVYTAQGSDVDTVMVAGQILMEGRELKTIDEEQAKWQTRRIAKGILG
ncbi:MAG: amidohydrolase [Symbiobacteriaceae bacterium]|nr:amidohydrolase [Symbiobacteriaceae bacterium]